MHTFWKLVMWFLVTSTGTSFFIDGTPLLLLLLKITGDRVESMRRKDKK
jgi:hypothetical protein